MIQKIVTWTLRPLEDYLFIQKISNLDSEERLDEDPAGCSRRSSGRLVPVWGGDDEDDDDDDHDRGYDGDAEITKQTCVVTNSITQRSLCACPDRVPVADN